MALSQLLVVTASGYSHVRLDAPSTSGSGVVHHFCIAGEESGQSYQGSAVGDPVQPQATKPSKANGERLAKVVPSVRF